MYLSKNISSTLITPYLYSENDKFIKGTVKMSSSEYRDLAIIVKQTSVITFYIKINNKDGRKYKIRKNI